MKIKPKLLLDACCGPCSTHCIEELSKNYDVTILLTNHNVHPEEEYNLRKKNQQIVADKYNLKIIYDDYLPNKWFEYVKGYENLKENDKRCELCFEYRFKLLKKFAEKNNFTFVTTTLTVSNYKDSKKIFSIAKKIFDSDYSKSKVKFLEYDFKKNNGYKKSIELSKDLNLYRQKYCGCIYSKNNTKIKK